jgi:integrase
VLIYYSPFSNIIRTYGIKKTGRGALGITAHGLRAGFAMDQLEKRGLTPVLRGGTIDQMPKDEEQRVRVEVSALLGHNRPQVTTAYSGPKSAARLRKLKKSN